MALQFSAVRCSELQCHSRANVPSAAACCKYSVSMVLKLPVVMINHHASTSMSLNTMSDAGGQPPKPQSAPYEIVVGGVALHFPFPPYPSQVCLASQMIKAFKGRKHALLESPTGTGSAGHLKIGLGIYFRYTIIHPVSAGKSLAILCSSISWQQSEKARLKEMYDQRGEGNADCESGTGEPNIAPASCSLPVCEAHNVNIHDAAADWDDFEPDKIWVKKRVVSKESVKRTVERRKSSNAATATTAAEELDKTESLSRIYICSRTHTQLSQLIKGLKSTVYTPSMAVLGSRDQLCIHPTVMPSQTKTEDCSKLIGSSDGSGCKFFQSANILSNHPSMRVVWDIEDIVTKGRQFRACPYFAAKDIAEKADVVFCPYSYLLDKLIRESAGIDLKNNIVIFDEAHNLEEQCREAASVLVTIALVNATIDMFDKCMRFPKCPYGVRTLLDAFVDIRSWILEREKGMSSGGDVGDRFIEFVAEQVSHQLSAMGLTADNVIILSSFASDLHKWHKDVVECSEVPNAFRWVCPVDGKTHSVVPAFQASMRTVQMVLLVSGYAHEFGTDYAMCLQQPSTDAEIKVNIWCLNSGVAFRDLREQCRSVVLTSGAVCVCGGSVYIVDYSR